MKKKRLICFLVFLLLTPIIYFMVNLFFSFYFYQKTINNFKNGDFTSGQKSSLSLASSLKRTSNFWRIGHPLFGVLPFPKTTEKIGSLFYLGQVLAESSNHGFVALAAGQRFFQKLLNEENIEIERSSLLMETQLDAVMEKSSQIAVLLDDFSGEEPLFGTLLLKLKKEYLETRSLIAQARAGLAVLPRLIPQEEKKTYLLLFQNNMELRPSGGFIGSFGLLTFDRGKLLDFEIQDVYAADGQLRGHVEPPAKLAQFLGQAGWYLRDSNWDPDFPSSSARAEWFLEKETGRRVDGVIGIDLFVAQRLLEAMGEIYLPDYKEKINAHNFFERAQFHNEVGFFPGSQAKKDFLGAVAFTLFEKIKASTGKELVKVGEAFYQSLLEKDLLISIHDEQARKIISQFNWDGALRQVQCPAKQDLALPDKKETRCSEDYLMVVEANVGVNKSNYYLERDLLLATKIAADGQVTKELIINYQNKSPSEIFPAGNYRNYLRLYTPLGSEVIDCLISEGDKQKLCQIDQTEEHQKKAFGFLVEIPVGKKEQVNITWRLPTNFTLREYRLFFQKQPGTRNDPLVLIFNFPPDWQILSKTASTLTSKGAMRYNTNLSQDKIFDLEFRKAN